MQEGFGFLKVSNNIRVLVDLLLNQHHVVHIGQYINFTMHNSGFVNRDYEQIPSQTLIITTN